MLRFILLTFVYLVAGCATKPAYKSEPVAVIASAPSSQEAVDLIGFLMEAGKLEQAEFVARKALEADPEHPALNYYKEQVEKALTANEAKAEAPRHIYPLRKPPQPRLQPL